MSSDVPVGDGGLQALPMQVETVPWDSLKPHPSNPRASDTELIKESIRSNQVYRPVYAAQDGTILAGHHLWQALRELGFDKVQVIRLPVDPESSVAKRMLLVDNRSADHGTYDDGLLLELLQELDNNDTIIGTGYHTNDLDDLIAKIEEGPLVFGDEEVERLPNMAEKLAKYQEMGRRMIVLDYDQDTYVDVTIHLTQLRERFGVQSNAEAVKQLLEEAINGVPA